MSLEQSVRDASGALRSERATERRRSAEALKDLLNAATSLLTSNQLRGTGLSWDHVFEDINEFVLKECEKFESNRSFGNIQGLCASLLHSTILSAIKGKAYINCNTVIEASLHILQSPRLTKAVGIVYMNLLHKYVLPCHHYLRYITPQAWEDLLTACVSISCRDESNVDNLTNLRVILQIIQSGPLHCHFTVGLRDVIPKLKRHYIQANQENKIQEVLLGIGVQLLKTMSSESRLTMCEFSETAIPVLLKFYQQNSDLKKKTLLFHFLELSVLVHHPKGRLKSENGSLAHNWNVWCRHLNSIMDLIKMEAEFLERTLLDTKFKFYSDAGKFTLCEHYVQLSAIAMYQVMHSDCNSSIVDEGTETPAKRPRYNDLRTFSDVICRLRDHPFPWISIVSTYVKLYSETISKMDLAVVLSIMDNYVSSTNNKIDWKAFKVVTCSLLQMLSAKEDDARIGPIIHSLLSSCIRYSSVETNGHAAIHGVIQELILLDHAKSHLPQLLKLYNEGAMPVTTESVATLNKLFHKYDYKFDEQQLNLKYLNWLSNIKLNSSNIHIVGELLIRLITKESFPLVKNDVADGNVDDLLNITFDNPEYNILATEFEIALWSKRKVKHSPKDHNVTLQVCINVKEEVHKYLSSKLVKYIDKFGKDNSESSDLTQYLELSLNYYSNQLKYNVCSVDSLEYDNLWNLTCNSLEAVYRAVGQYNSRTELSVKYGTMVSLEQLLSRKHGTFIDEKIRNAADEDFFRVLHGCMDHCERKSQEDGFDADEPSEDLRGTAIKLCTYYCKSAAQYRDDVLKLILDPEFYDFTSERDVSVALWCIETMIGDSVNERPIEHLFRLMQEMCKLLFRDPHSSMRLLEQLYSILEDIGSQQIDTMRNNSIIMLKGYMCRCDSGYYPPCMTALAYKCVAKITELKHQQWSNPLNESLLKGLSSTVHGLRLYTCYILNNSYLNMTENGLKNFVADLLDIFQVEVSSDSAEVLKDEAANRTATVLHAVSALTLARPMWMTKTIASLLEIAKNRNIDKKLIKKVLDVVVTEITGKPAQDYLRNNLISLVHYWINMNVDIKDMPYDYFGYESIQDFVKANMNWLIPAEVLWLKNGNLSTSTIIPWLQNELHVNENTMIETCFSNMLILSLPHFVHDKYDVSSTFDRKLVEPGILMYTASTEWVGREKFSTMYGQHFYNIILLATLSLRDTDQLIKEYHWKGPVTSPEPHQYTLQTYDLILKYLGDIIGSCILQYLCESQPLAISHILLNLWSHIQSENILEAKVLAINRYVVFYERIPLNSPLNVYVDNFVCTSLLNTLKACHQDETIKTVIGAVCRALYKVLFKILPDKSNTVEKIIPQIMSVVVVLKHEMECNEVDELLSYFLNDMRYCLKESIDMVDGALALTQGEFEPHHSSSSFLKSLVNFIAKLNCCSLETLHNMKTFLKSHTYDLYALCQELKNIKGFSEHCRDSIIHRLINSLTVIAVTAQNRECMLAACDCLALIGPCDLKTLVMYSPESQNAVLCVNPTQYMALSALEGLAANIFDENPRVIQKTTTALKSLLSFREGKFAMEQNYSQNDHLRPFVPKRKNQIAIKTAINDEQFDTIFNTPYVWIPKDGEKHDSWCVRVMIGLLNIFQHEDTYYSELREVCKLKTPLADKLIPACIGLVVNCASEEQLRMLSAQITAFFQYFYENSIYCSENSDGTIEKQSSHIFTNHKSSIETMLKVVDLVRLQRLQYKKRKDKPENYNYLSVNYHAVAWAACITGYSMAAVMYGELWCIDQNDGVPPLSPEVTAALPDGENIQTMFRKSYIAVGEFDSVYGCGTGHLSSEAEKRNHILRLGNFGDALLMHDIALSHTSPDQDTHIHSLHRGVIKSMHKSGLYHFAVQYIKCLPEESDLDDMKYECFSKLGDWSLIVDKSSLKVKDDASISKLERAIKASQYSCLKDCLNIVSTDGYETRLRFPLENAKKCISKLLKKSNIENCQVIYNATSNLQVLQEIEDYYELRCKKQPLTDLLNKWDVKNLLPFDDFKHIEPILSQRSLILEHAAKLDGSVVKDVVDLQLKYAELAMLNKCQQMSSRLVALAKRLQPGGLVSLVDARVFWASGHKDIALHLVKSIVHDMECTDRILRATALWQHGRWMMELRNESGRDILDKYLKQSLITLGDGGHMDTQLKVYLDLAKFADAEYEQVLTYMRSSTFENKVKCMKAMKGTASSIKELMSSQTPTRDQQRAYQTNDKLSKLEEAEITSTYKEKKRFLDLAMKYYLLSLSQGELSDLFIFRVISLWINNPTFEFDNSEDSLQQLLLAVPSRKYLPVLPQITPRLTVDNTSFGSSLNCIIERCAVDHPHHTLPILLALSNSHKDQMILNSGTKGTTQRSRASIGTQEEPRIIAAKKMVQKLSQINGTLETTVSQMDQMYNAMICLAYYTAKEKQAKHTIPRSEPLTKLKNLNSVLVPIVNLPVKKDCIYTDITSVVSFSHDFSLVGGINAPKKMLCKGSDGVDRTILLKGEDDLRQDAVMQQVFTIVNNLLELNQETSRHKLIIRTYKVVPLSRRSGVLEWCEGTDTIGNYLVGSPKSPGAHTRYRPKDITPAQARTLLTQCSEKGKSKEQKLAMFMKILSQFKPVFHHFFTENFLAPVTWYERRLAYTKSVATSSMVGYMLGLGDRHVQNILIDQKTAEVIHIDFGIAFDQARALPTPETVPFRLTQDIVAGFGPCGVEGVFRRSCEKTLQLLRVNQDTLLTILEVLLCDPLYTWTITAVQAKRKQDIPETPRDNNTHTSAHGMGDSGGANSGSGPAERALLAVRSKLCGTEGGSGAGMAVPGLVARLLQTATDPVNLAQLFHGWQPYL